MSQKPLLKSKQIWNLNFGYLGLQVCLTLVIANTSRILSSLGANTDELAFLWLVAPISGLIIQPIVGYYSDKTWTRFGRRIPYLFIGLITTAIMMLFMPNSHIISRAIPPVLAGVSIIFLMQGALNVAAQPYRALVGDMVNEKQSNLGFSIQTFLSNVGGLLGSLLPFLLAMWGVSNQAVGDEKIASSVIWSFYIGVLLLLSTGLWTCFRVREYPPKEFDEYSRIEPNTTEKQQIKAESKKETKTIFILLRLSVVLFFSWFAFYFIWVYTTDGIAHTIWNTADPLSEDYNNAGNWFGVMTGAYSIVAALFSILIPKMTNKTSRKKLFALSLIFGGISLISLYYITNQYLLLIPMIGIGMAWAMILTLPFAILSNSVPPHKMGFYMGVLNIAVVVPQIAAGLTGNFIYTHIAGNEAISMMYIAGISMLLGAISVVFIHDKKRSSE